MTQTVYGDLLFMINFSMDFLCFFLCAKLLHRKISPARFAFASSIGAIYALLALFIEVNHILAFVIDIAVCVIMCMTAFAPREIKLGEAAMLSAVYVAVSMLLGGIMTALFNLINHSGLRLDAVEDDGISAWLFTLIALVSAAVALAAGKFFRKKTSLRHVGVCIEFEKKQIRLDALCDSGNLLCDPISGKSVILADSKVLGDVFPKEFMNYLLSGSCADIESIDEKTRRRIRIIPSRSVDSSGLLTAILPDRVSIVTERGVHSVDALIAPVDSHGGFDSCGALVPTQLLV